MKNWKTNLGGLLVALGTIGVFGNFAPSQAENINKGVMAIGALVLGGGAKDHDVTGGTKTQ